MEEFSCSNDHMIIKGKRSKRPRPSSSSASSSDISTCTEEDEDMAKCLILLARGVGVVPENKFSSRKFTEMATTTTTTNGSKVGIYVYECKTCNRTFPSFQALGGHRASHKKPKTASDISDRRRSLPSDHEEEERQCTRVTIPPLPAINTFSNESKPKIHECSICGSEFASGQALGGHMRRHRPAGVATTNTNNNNSTRIGTSIDNDSISSHDVGGKARSVMSLDLNLPAPPEDDCSEEGGFHHQFSSPRLVFSAAPLVDCHY